MSFSHCMRKTCGKGVDYLDLSHVYMHPLTTYVQDFAPRRSILILRLHGLLEAMTNVDNYSLGGLGEEFCFGGHTYIASSIIHFLQDYEEIGAACKWFGDHIF